MKQTPLEAVATVVVAAVVPVPQDVTSVDVPDNDVPKAENPIVKAIEDVLVPLGILPKTGDNSTSIEIMSGITVMSAALLVLLIAKRRRKDA